MLETSNRLLNKLFPTFYLLLPLLAFFPIRLPSRHSGQVFLPDIRQFSCRKEGALPPSPPLGISLPDSPTLLVFPVSLHSFLSRDDSTAPFYPQSLHVIIDTVSLCLSMLCRYFFLPFFPSELPVPASKFVDVLFLSTFSCSPVCPIGSDYLFGY